MESHHLLLCKENTTSPTSAKPLGFTYIGFVPDKLLSTCFLVLKEYLPLRRNQLGNFSNALLSTTQDSVVCIGALVRFAWGAVKIDNLKLTGFRSLDLSLEVCLVNGPLM